ncbi:MAG: site-specific integrase [Bacteroidetes bacterium]|nr:site-specific integrase [Bacteroidota bacterium]
MATAGLNIFLSLKPKVTPKGVEQNPDDEYQIYIDCSAGRQNRKKVYTGLKVYRKDWDEKRKAIKRTDSDWSPKNRVLDLFLMKSKEIAAQLLQEGVDNGRIQEWKKRVVNYIRPKQLPPPVIYDFEKAYFDVLELQGKKIKESSQQVFHSAFNKLKEYCLNNAIPLDPTFFTSDFMQGYLTFLYDKVGLTDNSANKAIRTIQTALRKLMKTEDFKSSGIIVPSEFFETIVKSRKADKVFLTLKELNSIMEYIPDNEKLKRIKDIFLFQCFTGIRYSDLSHLKPEDIKQIQIDGLFYRFIEKRQIKTQDIVKIPLIKQAENILKEYKDNLPVPSNQKYNQYLKELMEKVGINEVVRITRYQSSKAITLSFPKWKLIGTHTARHTTATIGLQLGIPAKVVQATLGHTNFKTTEIYSHDDLEHNIRAMNKGYEKLDKE